MSTKKIIEGLWDCPSCGQKGIGGLTKSCPSCGTPQSEDTTFYLGTAKKVVQGDKAKEYGQGADWTCSFCGSLNRVTSAECSNCGASRTDSKGDYFENQKKKAVNQAPKQPQPTKKPAKFKRLIAFLVIVVAIIGIIVGVNTPKNKDAVLADKSWNRSIAIEEYLTLKESDWSVPDGGRVYDERSEIHHYNKVLDHYETVEVQRSRQVLDGYDEYTTYTDNGDGTFSEVTHSTPRYTTEYYYETEEQPVYVDVPEYHTKYYYEIERWIETRSVDTEGQADSPYWGEVNLAEKERESRRDEVYLLVFDRKGKIYETTVDQETWEKYDIGKNVQLTIKAGKVIEIN